MNTVDLVAAVATGGAAGFLVQKIPTAPLARSVAAAMSGYVAAAYVISLLSASRIIESGVVVGAISFGLAEVAWGIALVVTMGAGVHFAVGWIGSAAGESAKRLRPLIIGPFAGAVAALAFSNAGTLTAP